MLNSFSWTLIFVFLFLILYCLETCVNCIANCLTQKFTPLRSKFQDAKKLPDLTWSWQNKIWFILLQLLNLHLWQTAHWTLQTAQCTLCIAPAPTNASAFAHVHSYYTLNMFTLCHILILSAIYLSLHTENIQNLSGTQDLHGKMNPNIVIISLGVDSVERKNLRGYLYKKKLSFKYGIKKHRSDCLH